MTVTETVTRLRRDRRDRNRRAATRLVIFGLVGMALIVTFWVTR